MKKLVGLWNFLNGHKTNIGSFLITIYTFAAQLNIVTFNPDVLTVLGFIFGVGVAHKGVKFVKETM